MTPSSSRNRTDFMLRLCCSQICGYMRSSDEYRAQLIGSELLGDRQAVPVHIQQAAYLHRRAVSGEPGEQWRRGGEVASDVRLEQQPWKGKARASQGGQLSVLKVLVMFGRTAGDRSVYVSGTVQNSLLSR
uniref:Uncharacterized protein n=1 Tax=Aegilops tauschii subsp. strangulata TaxID=200361 RepID=A0A452ZXU0_AEGTS